VSIDDSKESARNKLYKVLFGGIDTLEGEECTTDSNWSLKPHPYDCTKYLNCYKGKTLVKTCADGYEFDSKIPICVAPGYAQC
jgi:hypothetical protein